MPDDLDLQNWQPPQGFVLIDSTVSGIKVYAPNKTVEKTPTSVRFECPQCGASTMYDPTVESVRCSHCGYIQQVHGVVVGDQAAQAEFTLETLQAQARGWGKERRELHCEACGADLSVQPNDLSSTCPFCGSNRVVNRLPQQVGLRPNFLIPFTISLEQCGSFAKTWLGRGWMHPSELGKVGLLTRFTGIYLPCWTFNSDIQSDWKAEVGHERTETYYDSSTRTHHTRTVIDWRWENGHVEISINDLLVLGTKNASPILFQKISPFDLSKLTIYDPEYLAGWQAKSYDINLELAWESGKSQMREKAKEACYQDIPTNHIRNFSMSADFNNEAWRLILLPIYLSSYKYRDKQYQVMVNGQTGVLSGQKPIAWWKVWLAIAGLLTPGAVLSLVGIPFLAVGGAGILPLFIGMILLVTGLVISGVLLRRAMQAGEA